MGDVAIALKVMPSSPEADLESIKTKVSELVKVQDAKLEPLAFGLKCLKLLVVRPDSEGGTEDLEAKIKEIEGVGDVEVENVTLL